MQTYTFALAYGTVDDPWFEEIDVQASSPAAALLEAERLAQAEYMPGYRAIVELPTGGTGGWCQIWSLK
jgi:hypothetical protein